MHIRRTVRATVGRIGAVTYPSRIVIPAAFLIPMEDEEALDAIMWREGNHRCELWAIEAHHELRVYVSDSLASTDNLALSSGANHRGSSRLPSRRQPFPVGIRKPG